MPKLTKIVCWSSLLLLYNLTLLICQPHKEYNVYLTAPGGRPSIVTFQLPEQQLQFEHLTTADGLPSNMNYYVSQDHLGFLWFSNQCGLVRYDGYQCKTFVPESNNPHSISTAVVNQVCEDSQGYLWISSPINGINKYERTSGRFTHFKHDRQKNNSLSSDSIFRFYLDRSDMLWIVHTNGMLDRLDTKTGAVVRNPHVPKNTPYTRRYSIYYFGNYLNLIAVAEDKNGNVWIGTRGAGATCYNREKNTCTQYFHDPNNPNSLSCDTVTCFYEDDKGNIWMGTWGGGLNRFRPKTNTFSLYHQNGDNKNSLSNDYCLNLFADRSKKLWITVTGGIDLFNMEKNNFRHFRYEPDNMGSLNIISSGVGVFAIPVCEDSTGSIWIQVGGSKYWGMAYDIYDPQSDAFSHYFTDLNNPAGIRGIYSGPFFRDNSGNSWIIGIERGINKLNPSLQQFTNYLNEPYNENSLGNNGVNCILESKLQPGKMWIGTRSGFDAYTIRTGEFRHYRPDPNNSNSLVNRVIFSLFEGNNGVLWIGTGEGFSCYDIKKDEFRNYFKDPDDPESKGPFIIWSIFEDKKGFVWLADVFHGLYRFKPETEELTIFQHKPDDPQSISSNVIRCIYQDTEGTLWIAAENGLNKFDYQTETFTRYLTDVGLHLIKEDKEGNFWLGTRRNGLGLFDRQTGDIRFFTTRDGLCNNQINSIVDDDAGNLWLGTEAGLSRFTKRTESFTNYTQDDGLPTPFIDWNSTKISNGQIWLSTVDKGIIAFYPEKIKNNPVPPKLVITDIKLFNETLKAGNHSPLKEDITVCKVIHLKHSQNNITLECAALHYSNPRKNQYAYWLENYDKDWYNAGTNRIASYTNLDPGKYIFHAKASNCDNVWDEEGISLRIIIHPPWWRTYLAYFLYLLFFGLLAWLIWREQLRRLHLQHELQMKQFEAEKLLEVDQLKSNFFATISHEFRTPLTLILGPTEQLISDEKENKRKDILQLILRNSRRLLYLINQLLDFSKLEAGQMKLNAKEEDIVPLLKGMVYSFSSMAEHKKISLTFITDLTKLNVFIDRDKLEKIISNLLSNAFKYTPEGGKIDVELSVLHVESALNNPGEQAQVCVSDNGSGIAPEHLSRIFDRYYRVDEKDGNTGTGIGLSLTRELVELHHGTIAVESKPAKGSVFIVRLPLGRNHLKNEEIAPDQTPISGPLVFIETKSEAEETLLSEFGSDQKVKKKSLKNASQLLIVEDTEDVRKYIRSTLDDDYQVDEAKDGLEGFEKAVESIPDLIISDVMMPGMDGFALCEKLKTDERTSHIPVILLTARASEASKLEGLETGADAYIIKPFSTKEIQIRVKNLIEQRRRLRERFSHDINLSPKEIAITSVDERFLNRAMEIIEKHLSDTGFGVDSFSREAGMSHSQLYRKVQALTNQSPVELIRSIRLKRAASLLKQKYGSISEIAYETGFNTPGYFTKCFQKQFGKSPSEFMEEQ
jgi:signal transduction histidine kinase/ligand-binding sensor domain-containing protein/DNA-binding response OmpR family regulator